MTVILSAPRTAGHRSHAVPGFWLACTLASSSVLIAGFAAGQGPLALALLSTALLVGLARLERHWPADAERTLRTDPQKWNDVGHLLAGSLTGEVLGNLVVVSGAATLAAGLPPVWHLWPDAWPVWAQVSMLLVAADFLEYWRHRLEHRVPWLWRFHALHHDADRMHTLKSSRNHVVDLLLRFLVVYAPLALAGAPPTWLPAYAGAILVFGPLSHANLDLAVPRLFHRLVTTPQVHALHHARDRRFADSNLSPVTPLWDQLFRTYCHPDEGGGHPRAFGIENETWPHGFGAQLLAPFRGPKPPDER